MPHQTTQSPGHTYFDLEGDKELHSSKSSEAGDVPLTWRGDPEETCSDWTIVVVTNELQTVTYHVHKSVLCFGPRASKYFAKIMQNHNSHSTPNKKTKHHHRHSSNNSQGAPSTKVELDQQDADNFPILLDFIYAPCSYMSCNGTVVTAASTITSPSLLTMPTTDDDCSLVLGDDITTKNAVSLRHLARTFEVDSLMLAVNKFIQKDLNFKTGPIYLSKASVYKDERLMESARRLCAENIQQIDIKTLTRLPVHLFRIVIKSLESFEEDNRELSHFLSEVVCRYLEKHPKSLSAELLLELTDELLMPYIESEAAIGFTALIKNMDSEDATHHWDGLVALCRRCARAVVQEYGWSDFSVNAAVDEYLGNSRTGNNQVSRVDSLLFATSFAAALEQAQDDYEVISVEQERLEGIATSLHQSVILLEKTNDLKDEHMAKQKHAIDEAKKQILKLKQQIGEIKKQQQRKRQPSQSPEPSHNDLQQRKRQPSQQRSPEPSNDVHRAAPIRELVSPSQVGAVVHADKTKKMKELRTRSEMRSRSLM